MKQLKKILNKSSDLIYNFLDKLATIIKNDNHSLLIKTIIKLTLLIIIYFACGLIAEGLIKGGIYVIEYIGATGTSILNGIWTTTVNFTYFLFIVVSIYQIAEMAEKDKTFFSLYKNKKKDKEVKKRIFFTLENIIKILGTIALIPLFITDIGLLFILGIMIGYLNQGVYLYSLFITIIGLIIFFTTIIFLIKKLLSPETNNFKKHLYLTISSGLIISLSIVCLLFETSEYKINNDLTTDFNTSTIKYEYKINPNKEYYISNEGNDRNIDLVIDDDLGSYLEIIIKHRNTNEVKTNLKELDKKIIISYEQDLNLEITDFEKIFNLGITSIKEKTIYNYTLLKYAEIEVRTSSDYAKYIKFVDSKGKEYNPYERLDK